MRKLRGITQLLALTMMALAGLSNGNTLPVASCSTSVDAASGSNSIQSPRAGSRHNPNRRVRSMSAVGDGLSLSTENLSPAAPGDLDPTFGTNGKVVTDISWSDYAGDVVLQPDGKIIVVGTVNPTSDIVDFVVVRYNGNGSLDASFGSGGKVITDFGGADGASAVAIQPDAKIVVAGRSNNDFALARYNPDGSLDSTFGVGGKVTTDFSGLPDLADAIVIQPDGKIIAAGTVNEYYAGGNLLDPKTDADFGLTRYHTDGSLDTTFGSGGKVSTEFNGRYDFVAALALQADGKIVAAGFAATPAGSSNWDLWDNGLARYHPDGSLDSTFGNGGKVVTDWEISGENGINALVVQLDGKLFTAGYVCHYDNCLAAITRYDPNGTLITQHHSGFSESGNYTDLALQTDGKIVAVNAGLDFGVERYNAVGTRDTSFGTGGRIFTDFGGWDFVQGIVIQPNGKIVAVGTTLQGNSSDIALARYLGDAAASSCANPNPIDCADFFVTQQYRDFLNREPDAPGWAFWTDQITECNDPAKRQPGESLAECTDRKRDNTSAAFFLSPEFQNTGSFVLRVYWGTLGKLPWAQCGLPNGLLGSCRPLFTDYVADISQVAQGIVVNNQLAPDVINANKRAFVDAFVNRPAFKAKYDVLSNSQFVDTLFATTGITPADADRSALVNGLNNGTETRASVVFKVVDGTETIADGALVFHTSYGKAFFDLEFDAAFVFMEYIGYLRRNPDQEGFDFWLAKLKRYGTWLDAQMVRSFIVSPEYRSRFGQP